MLFSSKCQVPVDDVCKNLKCPVGSGVEIPSYELFFDMRVQFSDHTGSLRNVRLSGGAAEQIVGCTVSSFIFLNLYFFIFYHVKNGKISLRIWKLKYIKQ